MGGWWLPSLYLLHRDRDVLQGVVGLCLGLHERQRTERRQLREDTAKQQQRQVAALCAGLTFFSFSSLAPALEERSSTVSCASVSCWVAGRVCVMGRRRGWQWTFKERQRHNHIKAEEQQQRQQEQQQQQQQQQQQRRQDGRVHGLCVADLVEPSDQVLQPLLLRPLRHRKAKAMS